LVAGEDVANGLGVTGAGGDFGEKQGREVCEECVCLCAKNVTVGGERRGAGSEVLLLAVDLPLSPAAVTPSALASYRAAVAAAAAADSAAVGVLRIQPAETDSDGGGGGSGRRSGPAVQFVTQVCGERAGGRGRMKRVAFRLTQPYVVHGKKVWLWPGGKERFMVKAFVGSEGGRDRETERARQTDRDRDRARSRVERE
jgi:hypothetical protein